MCTFKEDIFHNTSNGENEMKVKNKNALYESSCENSLKVNGYYITTHPKIFEGDLLNAKIESYIFYSSCSTHTDLPHW